MALFQKKPQTQTSAPLYTLGLNRTVLIVGLGNIGKEYELTRHNLGFLTIDNFAKTNEFPEWINKKDLKCQLTTQNLGGVHVILIKPTTMMNLSGESVQAAARFYRVEFNQITALHDEIDIPFGQIRTRAGGGAAGHNGIKSLIQHIGGEFGRVRIGIQPEEPPKMELADYVLGKLSKMEQEQLPNMYREVNSILTEYVYGSTLHPETRSFLVPSQPSPAV